MTLVITELSNTGIVMAADSAITKYDRKTRKVLEVDQQGWAKLLPVRSIQAGISYWGMIGAITDVQFDDWLKKEVINSKAYDSLEAFADVLVLSLNKACHNKPLSQGEDVGLHVAGYMTWVDGIRRPAVFHVHNGHGTTDVMHHYEMIDGSQHLVRVIPTWKADERKLFEKHLDFPDTSKTLEENLWQLQNGFILRNGSYFIYAVIWEQMKAALAYINLIPDVSIPRDPDNLGSRKGLLHTVMDMMVRIYRCSNQSPIIGGTVKSIAIGPTNYLLPLET